MKNYKTGFNIKNLIKSFGHAIDGIRILGKNEYNLYIQLTFAMSVVVAGLFFKISPIEWSIQTAVTGLVIFSELVNTSIEKIMDFVEPKFHQQVGEIKDLAAGSVLLMVLIAVSSGLFIYVPKIAALFLK